MPSEPINDAMLNARLSQLSSDEKPVDQKVEEICTELFRDFHTAPLDLMISKHILGRDILVLLHGICKDDKFGLVKLLRDRDQAVEELRKNPESSFYKKQA